MVVTEAINRPRTVTVDRESLLDVLALASDVGDRTAEETAALFEVWSAVSGVEHALAFAHVGQTHLDGERLP